MDNRGPEKKERLLAALDKGMVMVHLDARRPGVMVPTAFRGEAHLRLNLSYRFDPPDLAVGEWGVRATLSFSGDRFAVAIPWSALFAITSFVTEEFWMYPDDLPEELIQNAMLTDKVPLPVKAADDAPPAPKAQKVMLEVVTAPAPEVASASQESEPPDGPPKPPSRGHLRLVK
ncbi:MAG: ClpXP protease specificity-enhancing factor SspB [Myxococcaceae bacterium]